MQAIRTFMQSRSIRLFSRRLNSLPTHVQRPAFTTSSSFPAHPDYFRAQQTRLIANHFAGNTCTGVVSPSIRGRFRPITRRFHSTKPPSSQKTSFSQRMQKLSREYGWAALGVYLGLSALDFPFCFLAVRYLGAEKIAHYEHIVIETAKQCFARIWPFGVENEKTISGTDELENYGHGVVEAEERNAGAKASM